MKRLAVVAAVAAGLCVASLLGHLALIEIGREVIVLRTRAPDGALRSTRLWVVDDDGDPWVNGGGQGGWYGRLVDDPIVEMERDGATKSYRAVPVPEANARMHALLREKYGFADRWVRLLKDPAEAVPVRLEPVAGQERADAVP